ncbi:chromosome partitioning protein [Nitrosomonas cryotolerans]|uniref:Cellulose biosynthesis protein BcsQ n=1 Tax=Nitrosomonas cryotolerans ATCC 49181 TaxID=1131553 RepID=A0A1N6G246_9PROT|nr:ParA family protein [Nitrosomonas cryotolerans]SFQ07969.1 chromosome partitioning protein [Nitrosomonas cryotolerans]SIO01598.1 Cellulose biosynthesis protein BcsQ [Nitrosomonas cryotolerans ATCC 49181]
MARSIGIYNNKGGVGKTTLSLFLSDFLSSITINKKKSKVLVMDFDPQASCANAILGIEKVSEITNDSLTLPFILNSRLDQKKGIDLSRFIFTRERDNDAKTKKTRLGNLDVMVSEPKLALNFDEKASLNDSLKLARWIASELATEYDFIFVDLPGSISKINRFSLVGAFMVDYFVVPTELNRLNINALSGTLKMLDNIREWRGYGNDYNLLGFVLNKADKRTVQYKLHKDELIHFAKIKNCKIYKNTLPPTPRLSDAADDSIGFITLSERYDNYYDNVRNLVIEITRDLGYIRN